MINLYINFTQLCSISWSYINITVHCEQRLQWQSMISLQASSPIWVSKGSLAKTLEWVAKFVLCSDEGKYHWLKIVFQKSKLIDNRPSWPALNFCWKCRNTMLLSLKSVLCRRLLNSLRKRRPAEEEHHFLLWETTVVCVWNLVLRGIILKPRTCFSPQGTWAHMQCSMCVLIFLPRPPAFTSPLACLSCIYFSRYPLIGELARRLEHDVCVCELQAVSWAYWHPHNFRIYLQCFVTDFWAKEGLLAV